MDRRSKIFLGLFLVLIALSGAWKFYQFFIERNYLIHTEVSCDPETESCFVLECEDGDEECEQVPYKKLETAAYLVPSCDPYADEECPEPSCEPESSSCVVTYCSEDSIAEGESCYIAQEASADSEDEDVLETDSVQTEDE